MEAAANSSLDFAVRLFKAARKDKGNVLLSPYSCSACLIMLLAAAKNHTEQEMLSALSLPRHSSEAHQSQREIRKELTDQRGGVVALANRVWARKGWNYQQSFLDIVERYHEGSFAEVDFSQAKELCQAINQWVKEQTRGVIEKIIEASMITGDTSLVLVNALYFKACWRYPFDVKESLDQCFWVTEKEAVTVPMMSAFDYPPPKTLRYSSQDGWDVAELPYKGDDLVMTLIKPTVDYTGYSSLIQLMGAFHAKDKPAGKARMSLEELEETLTPAILEERLNSLEDRELWLQMPRFKIEGGTDLASLLVELGMGSAFSLSKADFSALVEGEPSCLDRVLQKVVLEVNEQGTELAAVTAAMTLTGAASMPTIFRLDRPFLCLIRDVPTGAVLFMGRIENPSVDLVKRGSLGKLKSFFGF